MKSLCTTTTINALISTYIPIIFSTQFSNFSSTYLFKKYLWKRYELKDLAMQKCGEIFGSVISEVEQDERLDYFAKFSGIKEGFYAPEAPLIYVKLIRELDIPLEIIFGSGYKQKLSFSDSFNHITNIMVNSSKDTRIKIKRSLFILGKIYINDAFMETITIKNMHIFWIMYKIFRVAKKPKVRQFIEKFFENFGYYNQTELREKLTDIILVITPKTTKENINDFFEKILVEKGKISGTKVLGLFKNKIEVKIDLSSYLQVGMTFILNYLGIVKNLTTSLMSKYSETKNSMNSEEFNKMINANITSMKSSWKIVAIMDSIFREKKNKEISPLELSTMLFNDLLMKEIVIAPVSTVIENTTIQLKTITYFLNQIVQGQL